MKAKIENGKLTIDLPELLESLSEQERKEAARFLVAEPELFAAVLECVADESRFGHFFSDDPSGPWSFDTRCVLSLREKLMPLMPIIAREAVREALHQRDQAQADERRWHDWAWKLFHAWPKEEWHLRPKLPDWAYAEPRKDEELPEAVRGGA